MSVVANQFRWALGWPVVLLLAHIVTAKETPAEKSGPRNNLPRPQVFHVLQELPAFQGGNTNRFHRGEHGEVVLDCGGAADLASTDGGKTWVRYTGARLWPSGWFGPFSLKDEQVAIHENQYKGALIRRSSDQGRTWSDAEPIPPALPDVIFPKLRGPYFFSVTVTRSGRIVIPEDYLTGGEGPDPDVLSAHTSGDGGRTWQRSLMIEPPDPLPKKPEGFGEPAVVELADGTLWMVFRSIFGELWQCQSKDGGLTWGPPSSTGLASPLANPRAATIPGTGIVVLVWNFAKPGRTTVWGTGPSSANVWGPRMPLAFAVSHDGCRTWSCPTIIDERNSLYANLHFSDNELFVIYEFQPPGEKKYQTGLAVYGLKELADQPAWTHESIQPYIDAGLVVPWLERNIP